MMSDTTATAITPQRRTVYAIKCTVKLPRNTQELHHVQAAATISGVRRSIVVSVKDSHICSCLIRDSFFFLHISAKITSPWSRWSLMKQDFSRKLASSWLIGVLVDVTASLGCFVKEATVLETWRWCRAEHGGISGINSLLIFFFCLFFCDNKKIVIL